MPQNKGCIPWNKGKTGCFSKSAIKKMSDSHAGRQMDLETKMRISLANKGKKKPARTKEHRVALSLAKKEEYRKGKESPFTKLWKENPDFLRGENNPKWIKDRSLIKVSDKKHKDPRYKQWKRDVHIRDSWECRISNADCEGRLEAHHILPWSKHPELRYEVNNGISLCHYHHPKKREEEQRLAPTFQEMVLRPAHELAQ